MSAYQGLENAVRTLRELRAKKLQEVAEIDSAIDDILGEMERLPREPDADAPVQASLDDVTER
jgi:hypothetical protein